MEKMSRGEIVFALAIPVAVLGLAFALGFLAVQIASILLKNIA